MVKWLLLDENYNMAELGHGTKKNIDGYDVFIDENGTIFGKLPEWEDYRVCKYVVAYNAYKFRKGGIEYMFKL